MLPLHEMLKKPFCAVALRSFTLDPDGMTTMTAYDVPGPLRRFKFAVVVIDCPALRSDATDPMTESSAGASGPSPSSPTSPTPLDDPFGSTAEQPVTSTAATARAAKRMLCASAKVGPTRASKTSRNGVGIRTLAMEKPAS